MDQTKIRIASVTFLAGVVIIVLWVFHYEVSGGFNYELIEQSVQQREGHSCTERTCQSSAVPKEAQPRIAQNSKIRTNETKQWNGAENMENTKIKELDDLIKRMEAGAINQNCTDLCDGSCQIQWTQEQGRRYDIFSEKAAAVMKNRVSPSTI